GHTSGSGGIVFAAVPAYLAIYNSTLYSGYADHNGGAIAFNNGGALLIDNSDINVGQAGQNGGGIYFSGNPAANPPAPFLPNTLLIRNSDIDNGIAQYGGGIYISGFNGTLLLQNSTMGGLTANRSGAAIFGFAPNTLTLQNSTITANYAFGDPNYGGAAISWYSNGNINLSNSVIANTNCLQDIFVHAGTPSIVTANYSLIRNPNGFTLSPSSANNLPFGTDPKLGSPGYHGGTTETSPPFVSPLIDAGSNALIPDGFPFDQRGPGFARISGSSVDIGAAEIDQILPAVQSAQFNYITGPQSLRYTLSERVSVSKFALELHNVSNGTIIPTANLAVAYDSSTNTATFTFPGYPFGVLPDGDYRAILLRTQVSDPSSNHPATDHMTIFHFLKGDLNDDRTVSIADFIALACNFGKTVAIYPDGDTNYDTIVSIADFIDLAAAFGNSLGTPPPTAALQPAAALSVQAQHLFSTTRHTHHRRHVKRHQAPPRLFRFE